MGPGPSAEGRAHAASRKRQPASEGPADQRHAIIPPEDGVFRVDRGWHVTWINGPAAAFFDGTPEGLTGRVLWDFAPGLRGSESERQFRAAMEEGQPREYVGASASRPGRWIESRLFPSEEGLTVFLRDVTRRVDMQEQLREREEQLSALISQSVAGFAQTDLNGKFTLVSDRFCKITGRSREELLGRTMQEITHPDDLPANLSQFRRAIEEGRPFVVEKRYIRPDGTAVWVNNSVSVLHRTNGELYGVLAVCTDISEQRAADLAVRENEARLRALTENLPSGLVFQVATNSKGSEGRFLFISESHEKLTGVPVSAVFADPTIPHNLILPEDRERLAAAEREAVATRQPFDVEVRFRHANGDIRWTRIISAPRAMPDGSLIWDGLQIDITDQKRTEEALRKSEEELQLLTDALPVLVAYIDADLRYRFINKLAEEWFPYRREEIIGTTVQEAIGEEAYEAIAPRIRQALAGEPVSFEQFMPYRRGRPRWVRSSYVPRPGRDGTVEGFYALVEDISDEKRNREELRELNEALEKRFAEALHERKILADIVEGTDALVQVIDPDYRWLAFNRAAADEFQRVFGVRPRIGATLPEVLGGIPDHFEVIKAFWDRALAGEKFTETGSVVDPEGELLYFEMKFDTLRDAAGRPIGAYHFVQNVTARMREQERLAEAEEALRQSQKMEAMGQLTGGVAHDFNNLLTPILGCLDLLQRRQVGTEREQRMIAGAVQSAQRAQTLVQRLLAFARRQPLQMQPVDLRDLIGGMAELLSSTSGPRVQVEIDVEPDLPPARADPNQLEMALLNLAVNARDAMSDGGRLTISAHAQQVKPEQRADLEPGHYLLLAVSDTGQGMDEATLSRAVEPFFSTKGLGKGTGLGLSMVHGLAAQLGGALVIKSKPMLGTRVELWLPVSEEELPREGGQDFDERAHAATGTALLVDDEELVRASIKDMLNDLGFTVAEARSGEAALEMVQSGLEFDLLVSDHLMPGMGGAELAREVRRLRPDAAIVMVSGYADIDEIAPDLPRLAKPFQQSDLAAIIGRLRTEAG